jgi:hypothetical protein
MLPLGRICAWWEMCGLPTIPDVDPAYIYLTDEQLPPGRASVPVDLPAGMQDLRSTRLEGRQDGRLEVLHSDLLAQVIRPGQA